MAAALLPDVLGRILGLNSIAKAANVSTGIVSYHFPAKAAGSGNAMAYEFACRLLGTKPPMPDDRLGALDEAIAAL